MDVKEQKNKEKEVGKEIEKEIRKEMEVEIETQKKEVQGTGKAIDKKIAKEAPKKAGQGTGKEIDKEMDKEAPKKAGQGTGKEIDKEMDKEAPKKAGQGTGKEIDKEMDKEAPKRAGQGAGKEIKKEAPKETDQKPDKEVEVKPDIKAEIKTEADALKKTDRESEKGKQRSKKGGRATWIVLALVLVLLVSLAAVYVSVARSYRNRFLPASLINGIDCSDMNTAEVLARLTPSMEDYTLEVMGRDYATGESGAVLGRISASDIDMRYEGLLPSVENALAQQNAYKWPLAYLTDKTTNYSVVMTIAYDEEKAKSLVQTWDAFQTQNMQESENAYISEYSDKTNSYKVIPKTVSTRIDLEQAYKHIIASLHDYKKELDIEAMGCYEDAAVQQDEEKLINTVNTVNKWLSTSVTYDWNGRAVVLDKELLHEWISIVDNEPVLDTEQVRRFVKRRAAENDTYGKNGNFTTAHNVKLSLYRASYGWKTDIDAETQELVELIQQGSITNREPVYSVTGRVKGTDDIGDSYVEIDLTHQHLYLYIDGQNVLETDFVSGNMSAGNATPQGIFGLTYKKTDAVLRGADYETPVNYWMPFYGNYGMHDATWRRVFGGNIYLTGGSHGCVNLPLNKAAVIYEYISKGFPIICYYYQVDPLTVQETPPADPAPSGGGQEGNAGQPTGESQGENAGQPTGGGQGGNAGQPTGESQGENAGQPTGGGQGGNAGPITGESQGENAGQPTGDGQGGNAGQPTGGDQGESTGQPTGDGQGESTD